MKHPVFRRNPLHAIDNARKARDQANAAQTAQEKETQEMLGEKASPKVGPAAPAPKQP